MGLGQTAATMASGLGRGAGLAGPTLELWPVGKEQPLPPALGRDVGLVSSAGTGGHGYVAASMASCGGGGESLGLLGLPQR